MNRKLEKSVQKFVFESEHVGVFEFTYTRKKFAMEDFCVTQLEHFAVPFFGVQHQNDHTFSFESVLFIPRTASYKVHDLLDSCGSLGIITYRQLLFLV